jgi:hypothetical protein
MINELEKLARAATPGDWRASDVGNVWTNVDSKRDTFFICSAGGDIDDSAYIAAANPATMLKLIKVIRAQHEALEAVKNDLLMRSDYIDDDGTEVVDCGSSVWWQLGDALAKAAELGVE